MSRVSVRNEFFLIRSHRPSQAPRASILDKFDLNVDYAALARQELAAPGQETELHALRLVSRGISAGQTFESTFVVSAMGHPAVKKHLVNQRAVAALVTQVLSSPQELSLVTPIEHFLRNAESVLLDLLHLPTNCEVRGELRTAYAAVWSRVIQKYKMNRKLAERLDATFGRELSVLMSKPSAEAAEASLEVLRAILCHLQPNQMKDLAEKVLIFLKFAPPSSVALTLTGLVVQLVGEVRDEVFASFLTDKVLSYVFDTDPQIQRAAFEALVKVFRQVPAAKQSKIARNFLDFCKTSDRTVFNVFFLGHSKPVSEILATLAPSDPNVAVTAASLVDALSTQQPSNRVELLEAAVHVFLHLGPDAKTALNTFFRTAHESPSSNTLRIVLQSLPCLLGARPRLENKTFYRVFDCYKRVATDHLDPEVWLIMVSSLPKIFDHCKSPRGDGPAKIQNVFFFREFEAFFEKLVRALAAQESFHDAPLKCSLYESLLAVSQSNLEQPQNGLMIDAQFPQIKTFINEFLAESVLNDLKTCNGSPDRLIDAFLQLVFVQIGSKEKMVLLMRFQEELVTNPSFTRVAMEVCVAAFEVLSQNCLHAFIVPLIFELGGRRQSGLAPILSRFIKLVMWLCDFNNLQDINLFPFAKVALTPAVSSPGTQRTPD